MSERIIFIEWFSVCYLAGEYARILIEKYRMDEEKSKKKQDEVREGDDVKRKLKELEDFKLKREEDRVNILCIQIAGLCHDLGTHT